MLSAAVNFLHQAEQDDYETASEFVVSKRQGRVLKLNVASGFESLE